MLILGLLFAALMLLAVTLNKAYYHVPGKELKRRARAGDQLARQFYRTAAYGLEARLLLGALAIVFAGLSFVFLAVALPGWAACALVVLLLWLGYLWIPATKLTGITSRFASWCSGPIAWMLNIAHPMLSVFDKLAAKHYPFHAHTDLFDEEDLLELLEWQKEQPDNRVPSEGLSIAQRALTFGNHTVAEAMTPMDKVRMVKADDAISPVMIDELHKSGHTRFPVYEGKKTNIVGTLYLRDITNLKHEGKVREAMQKGAHYVHEDFSLHQVLQAFYRTHQQLFIVVNKLGEFVGIISIEDILGQIIGQPLYDEFDEYDNPQAVAEKPSKKASAEQPELVAETELAEAEPAEVADDERFSEIVVE